MDWTTSPIVKHCKAACQEESLRKRWGVSLRATAWMGKEGEELKGSKIIEAATYHIFLFLLCLLLADRPSLLLKECRDSLCYSGISRTISM